MLKRRERRAPTRSPLQIRGGWTRDSHPGSSPKKQSRLRDVTTNRRFGNEAGGFSFADRQQHILEIVLGGFRPVAPEVHVSIVDASVIKKPAGRRKHGRLGRDLGLRFFDERMLRVAERLQRIVEILQMFSNRGGSFIRVRVNQKKLEAVGFKSGGQTLNLGRISIGDGTIGTNKNEHGGPGRGTVHQLKAASLQIENFNGPLGPR